MEELPCDGWLGWLLSLDVRQGYSQFGTQRLLGQTGVDGATDIGWGRAFRWHCIKRSQYANTSGTWSVLIFIHHTKIMSTSDWFIPFPLALFVHFRFLLCFHQRVTHASDCLSRWLHTLNVIIKSNKVLLKQPGLLHQLQQRPKANQFPLLVKQNACIYCTSQLQMGAQQCSV